MWHDYDDSRNLQIIPTDETYPSSFPISILESNYSFTEIKIKKFEIFKEGWDSGEGVRFENSIIQLALNLNREMSKSGFLETDAFPVADGSIMVILYSEESPGEIECLEFTIHSDKKISFTHEKNDSEISCEEDLSFIEAIEKITNFSRGKTWDLSELSIPSTMIPKKDASTLHASNQPLMKKVLEEFRLLANNASITIDIPYVST